MSQKETADAIGPLQVSESSAGNLSKLAELARQAFEQKRAKDCLDLTRAMLLIDPDNADAQWMRLSVQSEMHRDLENSRAFLQQAQTKEKLEGAQQSSESSDAAVAADAQLDSEGENLEPSLSSLSSLSGAPNSRRRPAMRWLVGATVLSVFIVLGASVVASLPKFRTKSNPIDVSPASNASDRTKQSVNENTVQQHPSIPTQSAEVEVVPTPPGPALIPAPAPPPRPAAALQDRPVAAAAGTLAISSPTSVDIYKDDAYLGSVPISLELPAGTHTLEYRHGSLLRSVTHVVNSNETTRAMITFDVSIPINSKPWAEVFLDGAEKRALGQTPLGGVRIPIGSVLIFENPQFQTKKYRVTGNETGIQIVFP